MFEAYVTNPGLYPELGVEAGETLRFPTTTEEVQGLFSRIGIDGVRYGEYFINSYDSDVLGLYDCLDEYTGLDELNYLAHVLEDVQERGELEKFEAAMAFGEHTDGAGNLINLAQNLDCYDFYPGIGDDEALGHTAWRKSAQSTFPNISGTISITRPKSPCSLFYHIFPAFPSFFLEGNTRLNRLFSPPILSVFI